MTEQEERQKVLDTIRKLMTLAENEGASAHEAATAARKAHALMERHNIEYAEAIISEIAKHDDALVWDTSWAQATAYNKKVIEKHNFFGKFVPDFAQWLSLASGRLYDCQIALGVDARYGKCIKFFGYREDVIVAKWTFEYLMDCVRRETRDYLLSLPQEPGRRNKKEGMSFRVGMARAICNRIAEMMAAKASQPSGLNALVVVKEDAIRRKFGDFVYGKTKDRDVDFNAERAGDRAGKRVNINPNVLEAGEMDSANLRADKRRSIG